MLQLSLFDAQPDFDKSIRRTDKNGIVYFSLVDIMAQFSDLESTPRVLWSRTKKRLEQDEFQVYQNVIHLKLPDKRGRPQLTDCADGQTCLRIVQSIPSPKAEPIRQWLAQLGYERLEETLDPELGVRRARQRAVDVYQRMGKDGVWISDRIDGTMNRNQLTDILKAAVINPNYAQATTHESMGLFGRTPKQISEQHGYKNSRDGMTRQALALLSAVEATVSDMLKGRESVPVREALEIIDDVAGMYRLSVERVQAALGIDLATGAPLLGAQS